MTGKEFKEQKAKIHHLRSIAHDDQAHNLTILLIEQLFQERKFSKIVELFNCDACLPRENFYMFEVAYSLNEMGYIDEAEGMYEYLLTYEPNNSVILNNLSHIKRQNHKLGDAFELIRRAYELVPHDEVIAENYQQLYAVLQQQQSIREKYTKALSFLANEHDIILERLQIFLNNLGKEPQLQKNQWALPEWKFSVLMELEGGQAGALRDDWLEKGYLRDTRKRGGKLEIVYEVNPFLEKELERIEPKQLPPKWLEGFERLTIENLERLSYFSILRKIRTMPQKYRDIAERDVNELFLNYLMNNEKAVIVLSGSLIEVVLLFYCEKNNMTTLYIPRKNNKTEKRDLYASDLGEILTYLKEKKILSDIFVHAGNIARIYRNFIHPGKEMREAELLNQPKIDLCFISTVEIINTLL